MYKNCVGFKTGPWGTPALITYFRHHNGFKWVLLQAANTSDL